MSSTIPISGDEFAINLASVSKMYRGRVHALQNVSLQVGSGEIFGLLGPNGAGKSTLVKILMTVVRPTRCRGRMLGRPVGDKGALRKIGYLPEHHRIPDYMTGVQALNHYAVLGGVPRRLRKKRASMLLELVDMTRWSKVRIGRYSKGMRQRIGIAQALMSNPDLVILDEPTDGLDPMGRRETRNILQRLKAQGTTVFINSHILTELEQVCDRVAVLVQGRLAQQGTIDEMTTGQQRFEIEVTTPSSMSDTAATIADLLPAKLERLPSMPNSLEDTLSQHKHGAHPTHEGKLNSGPNVDVRPGLITVWSSNEMCIQDSLKSLTQAGILIKRVQSIRPSLEDLFMQAVRDPNTGELLHTGGLRTDRRSLKSRGKAA